MDVRKTTGRIAAVAVACVVSYLPVQAQEKPAEDDAPLLIQWADLAPDEAFPDPFKKLTQKQLQDVGYVSRVHYLLGEEKIGPDAPDVQRAKDVVKRLNKDGVDVVWLLAQRRHIQRMRENQANAVNAKLNGKNVSLQGFVFPVEMSGNLITEFLLIPYFDACSHGTPPPPNQVVFVTSAEGIARQGRVTFAKVMGRIEAKESQHSRQNEFGIQKFNAAYAIKPSEIKVAWSEINPKRKKRIQ